jgi:hypothetical protein
LRLKHIFQAEAQEIGNLLLQLPTLFFVRNAIEIHRLVHEQLDAQMILRLDGEVDQSERLAAQRKRILRAGRNLADENMPTSVSTLSARLTMRPAVDCACWSPAKRGI